MDYIAPRNYPPTVSVARPSYPDGNRAAGQKGAIPPGAAIEHPMREIIHCIEQSGQEPNLNDLTQLWQAILAAVVAGGGGGGSPPSTDFSASPFFPEVVGNGGLFMLTPSAGQIVVADGTTFVHRGGNKFLTTDTAIGNRTFLTSPSKTYHLRWRYNGGAPAYELKDLADGVYNPGVLAETDVSFDTTFDNMLIAKVVTDGGNALTTTPLVNKMQLAVDKNIVGVHDGSGPGLGWNGVRFNVTDTLNWSRTPSTKSLHLMKAIHFFIELEQDFMVSAAPATHASTPNIPVNRYALAASVMLDITNSLAMHWSARA